MLFLDCHEKHLNFWGHWPTGFSLCRRLSRDLALTVTRNTHQKAYRLDKRLAGYLSIVESIFDENKIRDLVSKAQINKSSRSS